jgi:cephalosporin hydroxylase
MATARTWLATRPAVERAVTALFHRMYYTSRERTWNRTTWLGTTILKCPLDLWIYQELLVRVRPDLIIETGTWDGGGAYYLATICDLVDNGRVITIDIESHPDRPQHPRITYLEGSSTAPAMLQRVTAEANGTVMVILDSDHTRDHVAAELAAYHSLVTPGSYLIVEDTNINGHPAAPGWGPGPMEALDEFLPSHPEFRVDADCEKFFMTFNPRGYLQRS